MNDQREVLCLGRSMGLDLGLAQVYLEVACKVVHLSTKKKWLKYEHKYVLCLVIMIQCLCCKYA